MKIPSPRKNRSQSNGNHEGTYGGTFEEQKAAADKAKELPPIDDKAFHGIIGKIALAAGEHTEADPRGVLLSLLIGFGNSLGRSVYSKVGDTSHYCNEFGCLVGVSAKARKGLTTDIAETIIGFLDDEWKRNCIARSLSTGEGLITLISDEIVKSKKKKGDDGNYVFEPEVVREGVSDKRKLCILPELGELLTIMGRDGNALASALRMAWDSRETMEINTKNSPARATGAHISIIGNITKSELLKLIPALPNYGGFANRFMWILVRSLKCFPEGGAQAADYLATEITKLREALRMAHTFGKMERSEKAKKYWADLYEAINANTNSGREVVDRAEAHMLRLSNMYATASASPLVDLEHLLAAEALWRYSEACALQIFGADELCHEAALVLDFICGQREEGATRTLIQNRVFHNHRTGAEITTWLRALHDKKYAWYKADKNEQGYVVETWFAPLHSKNGAGASQGAKAKERQPGK